MACDCLGKCARDEDNDEYNWCYQMMQYQQCDDNMKGAGCSSVEPFPLVWQSQFDGKRICGTTGGNPFYNVTRPDAQTLACPDGTEPCLTTTPANETLCYPSADLESSCPITDIQIVDQSSVSDY